MFTNETYRTATEFFMEDNQKSFIINKGLSLGLILTLFPIFDLMFGISIGWTSFFKIIFLSF